MENNNIELSTISHNQDEDDYNNLDDMNPDDDPILTATITFDVTVDPNGQVISTSEGQIISESFQNPIDGISLADHQQIISRSLADNRPDAFLTDANVVYQRVNEGEDESDDDSVSTSTESLIERSKKYMNEEAGIIILKRDNSGIKNGSGGGPKNFNINLDFDLKNQKNSDHRGNPNEVPSKNFNINLDFDLNNEPINAGNNNHESSNYGQPLPKDNIINMYLDFDLKNNTINTKTGSTTATRKPTNGLDIDLMITRNTTTERSESFEEKIEEVFEEEYMIENNTPYLQYRSPNLANKILQENKNENEFAKIKSGGVDPSITNQNARYEFIERLVERATQRSNLVEQNEYYEKQLPKAKNFSLEDCIEKVLQQDTSNETPKEKYPILRSFETLDIEALTRGFESEEINEEGKLVLYITEKQLLQLLNQRAIIIPNKQEILASNELKEKKLSLVDETIGSKLGRESPLKEVELIIDQDNVKVIRTTDSYRDDSYDEKIESILIEQHKANEADSTVDGNGRGNRTKSQAESMTSFHHSKYGDDSSSGDKSVGELTESVVPREIKVRELDDDESLGSSLEKEKHEARDRESDDGSSERGKNYEDRYTQFSSRGETREEDDESDSNGQKRKKSRDPRKCEDEQDDDECDKNKKDSKKKKCPSESRSRDRSSDRDGSSSRSRRSEYSRETDSNQDDERDCSSRKRKPRRNSDDDNVSNDNDLNKIPQLFDKNYKAKPLDLNQSCSGKDNLISDEYLEALRKSFEELRDQLKEKTERRSKPQGKNEEPNQFPPDYVEINKKLYKNINNQSQRCTCCGPSNERSDQVKYQSEDVILKDIEIKTPCCIHGYGTSYTFPDESDGRLIHYKDFDLLLPSENFEVYPDQSSRKFNIPKAYEFLENGLDYTTFSDGDALRELDGFVNVLRSSMNGYGRIDWNSVARVFSTPDGQEKAGLMKKFVNGLTSERKANSSSQDLNDALSKLDDFVSRIVVKHNIQQQSEQNKLDDDVTSLSEIEELVRNLKDILTNWKRVKLPDEIKEHVFNVDGNKIVIRTTRKLPSKVYSTGKDGGGKNYLKKNIIYSYTDDYDSSRLFDLSSNNTSSADNYLSGQQSFDLFNTKYSLNYTLKSFDPVVLDSLGKPSVDQVSKYVSMINTGVKNNSLIQIHPIMDPDSKIKVENFNCHESRNNYEPVVIDSGKNPTYLEEIAKNFGSLCVTDFPIYVQGFDLNYNKEKSKPITLMKQENKSTETVTNCKQRQ